MSWSIYNRAKEEKLANPKHGPHGLGHPDDKRVRKVEKDSIIAELMRERAKEEYCSKQCDAFGDCFKQHKFTFFFKCREESNIYQDCMNNRLKDKELEERCTKEYLDKRSEYRRTGIPQKILGSSRISQHTH